MHNLNLTINQSAFKICLEPGFSGVVVSCRMTKPMPFGELSGLILGLEQIMETQNFPQAYQKSRSFQPSTQPSPYAAFEPSETMTSEEVAAFHGSLLTLDLAITSRASSCWQGYFQVAGQSERQSFSSVLELIRILDQLATSFHTP